MVFIELNGKDKRKIIVLCCQECEIGSINIKQATVHVENFKKVYILKGELEDIDYHIYGYNAAGGEGYICNVINVSLWEHYPNRTSIKVKLDRPMKDFWDGITYNVKK